MMEFLICRLQTPYSLLFPFSLSKHMYFQVLCFGSLCPVFPGWVSLLSKLSEIESPVSVTPPFLLLPSVILNLVMCSYSGTFILWCEIGPLLMFLNTMHSISHLQSTSQRLTIESSQHLLSCGDS